MKIQKITDKIHSQQMQKKQSFKGLWGETHNSSYMLDSSNWIYEHRKTKDYFPFLDEPNFEINRVVRNNSSSKGGPAEDCDLQSVCVEIKERLGFTKKEWNKYLSGARQKAHDLKERLTASMIENNLRKLNLQKYIR